MVTDTQDEVVSDLSEPHTSRMHKLVKQFQKYLAGKPDCKQSRLEPVISGESVYVKRWSKRKQATLFSLSNNVTHVCFSDLTELVIVDRKQLTYVDLLGDKRTVQSAELDKDIEVSEKLQLVRSIIRPTKDPLTRTLKTEPQTEKRRGGNLKTI